MVKREQPKVIVADELQLKFGGQKSFDWAIEDNSGSSSPVPGFQTYEMQEDIQ